MATSIAHAQTAPDAGSLVQQAEGRRTPVLPPKSRAPDLSSLPPSLQLASGKQIRVVRFELSGQHLLDERRLKSVLAPFEGRSLDFRGLQEAAAAVGRAYSQAGLLARAYLPAQDVTDGVIQLRVVEARLGSYEFSSSARHLSTDRARALLQRYQAAGDPVELERLQRGLLLLGDVPGVISQAALRAGQADGETDVVVGLKDSALLTGNVTADNAGSRSTGEARIGGDLSFSGLMGIGDRMGLQASHTQGSDYVQTAVSLPLPGTPVRFGMHGSAMRYHLVQSEFDALKAKGRSDALGFSADYPIVRTRDANLYLNLSTDRKHFHNEANAAVTSAYRSRVHSVGLSGNRFDEWLGGGSLTGSLQLDLGYLDLNGSPSLAADVSGAQTAGRFDKLRYSLSRLQALTEKTSLFVQVNGQYTDKNLDSSERFYLGGVQGVRAYPVSEGGGSLATLVNVELQSVLGADWRGRVFYDRGEARAEARPQSQRGGLPNSFVLQGAGVSLAWRSPIGADLSVTLARRIGSNPLAGAQGRDQDGSLRRNRFWLQASLPFSY